MRPLTSTCLLALLAGFASGAPAQESSAADGGTAGLDTIAVEGTAESESEPAPRQADSGPATELAEVIVTARRREEGALQVPVSMAVVSGDDLAEAGLFRPQDIQQRTPGMTVSVASPRLTQYTIRGLGSTSQNDGMESSVGLFLDGVYLGRQGLSMFDLVDLDRVEVLRGPQGTLFGKNTTAGALNIATKLPSQTYEASLEGSLGDQAFRQARGSVTGPLVDGVLAGRLTGYVTQKQGQYTNRYDGSDLNEQNRYGVRGQLLWTPIDSLSARLIAEYGKQDETCCVYPLIVYRDAVRARDEFMEYERASLNPYDRQADADTRTHSEVEQKAVSVELNWDYAEAQRLTSITAYRHWTAKPTSDDATSLELIPETGIANDHRQFSQELRINIDDERYNATAGLFYLYQDLTGDERNILGKDIGGWTFGGIIRQALPFATVSNFGPVLYALIPPATLDGMRIDTDTYQKSHSAAAFGSVDWHLSEQFDLTTGLRYTHEWKDAGVLRTRTGGCPNCSVLAATNVLTPLGDLLGIDLRGATFDGLLDGVAGGDYERYTKRDEGNFSGQTALSYKPNDDTNAYVSIALGYKGGGINLGATGDSVPPTFKPEKALSYEIGLKNRWLANRLRTALAIYQTDVDDYQALTFDDEQTLIPNPRQINLLNVGKVRLRGAEAEAQGIAAPGLLLRASAAYNDAVTLDFPNAPDVETRQNTRDLSGETLYNAPRWTVSTGAEYSLRLREAFELYSGLDYYYRSGAWATVEHGEGSYIDAYDIVNARLGLRDAQRRWDVSAFVRNVFDERYLAAIYALYGVGDYGGTAGDERSYGVTLRFNFD